MPNKRLHLFFSPFLKVRGKLLHVSLKLKTSQWENVLLLKVAAEEKQQKQGEGVNDKMDYSFLLLSVFL